jgi:hypothetical protein
MVVHFRFSESHLQQLIALCVGLASRHSWPNFRRQRNTAWWPPSLRALSRKRF